MSTFVGIDIHQKCSGALRFAAWFCGAQKFHCLSVVSESYLRHAAAFGSLTEIMNQEQRTAQAVVTGVEGLPEMQVELLRAEDVSDGLVEATADGLLILGRNAGLASRTPIRLGSVARRVLRKRQSPTVVVPANLTHVGSGPVVLATACDSTTDDALRFAREVAERTQRPLHVVHAIPMRKRESGYALEVFEAEDREQRSKGQSGLESWGQAHGLKLAQLSLLEGDPIDEVLTFASRQDAVLLVTSPRPRSPLVRWVASSFSSELLGYATCAVAVA